MTRKIQILDTTLRDGEQSPGASMNSAEKLIVARQLLRLGVDAIEAGFPASGPSDFRAVQEVGQLVGDDCVVCAFARANERDIDVAVEALKTAKRPRIQTGLGVSPVHLSENLHLSEDECVDRAKRVVSYAKRFVEDVEFYAEDAGRADQEFLVRVVQAAVDAGATVINIPDTTGYSLPEDYGARIANIMQQVKGIEDVTVSVHAHDDLGMATAIVLAGVRNGATQVECTINGLGERAGDAALEEVVMAIKTHGEALDAHTDIRTRELMRASRLVSRVTGAMVQANKSVVGANAFAHSAGFHQEGVLQSPAVYQIMDPIEVGSFGSEIVLSSRSGHAALRHRLAELGYSFAEEEFGDVYARFLEMADQKKEVYDEDLESMLEERSRDVEAIYTLDALQIQCGDPLVPTAVATITDEKGEQFVVSATGIGPIDAAYKAINQVVSAKCELEEYVVKAITRGIDAIGEVLVRIKSEDGKLYSGRGADNDVVVSSAKAYVNAINRMITTQRSREVR